MKNDDVTTSKTKFYEYLEKKTGGAFATYGRFVEQHAWKFVIATIVINLSLGIGFVRFTWNKDLKLAFLPRDTESQHDEDQVKRIFPDLSGSNFNLRHLPSEGLWARVVVKDRRGNLLDNASLTEIQSLSSMIQNITTRDDEGNVIHFSDICTIRSSKCALEGNMFWDVDFREAVSKGRLTFPIFVSQNLGPSYYAMNTGGKKSFDQTGQYLIGTEYLRLEYTIRSDGIVNKRKAEKWMEAFEGRLGSFFSDRIEIAYGHYNSLNKEVHKATVGDIYLFIVSISLMITYAICASISSRLSDQVGHRVWIGIAGVFAAGLAVISSFGLCSAAGLEFFSIIGASPFLIIGIGIDDMFILMSSLSDSLSHSKASDKLAETLRMAGVGITITTVTDVVAFMAGASSNFIAVRNFCIYTGVAILFCYINNIAFLVGCIAINERRMNDNRHYLTCQRLKTKEELLEDGRSKAYVLWCGGRAPKHREEAESFLDKLPRWIIPKIVLKFPVKMIILFVFLVYLIAAVYGCFYLKQGLVLTQLLNHDSYFYKFTDWNDKFFTRQTLVSFVIPTTYDYSKPETQQMIAKLVSGIKSNRYFDIHFPEINWLNSYKSSPFYNDSSESVFVSGLQTFLNSKWNIAYGNDVVVDSINKAVTSSRLYFMSSDLGGTQEEGKMMLESRDIAKNAEIDCFATSPYFIYFEQYVSILSQTMQSVGIALVVVFIVTCIFMPHPAMICFVTISVAMIMTGVFGFMLYFNVALSAMTMLQIIMCVGFAIDFTAHICHGYIKFGNGSRDKRVIKSLNVTAAPIFHGAMSSIIGLSVLHASLANFSKVFAELTSFLLFLSMAHALLFLPVILTLFGPGRHNGIATDSSEERNVEKGTKYIPDTNRKIKNTKEINAVDKSANVTVTENAKAIDIVANVGGTEKTRVTDNAANDTSAKDGKVVDRSVNVVVSENAIEVDNSANDGFEEDANTIANVRIADEKIAVDKPIAARIAWETTVVDKTAGSVVQEDDKLVCVKTRLDTDEQIYTVFEVVKETKEPAIPIQLRKESPTCTRKKNICKADEYGASPSKGRGRSEKRKKLPSTLKRRWPETFRIYLEQFHKR